MPTRACTSNNMDIAVAPRHRLLSITDLQSRSSCNFNAPSGTLRPSDAPSCAAPSSLYQVLTLVISYRRFLVHMPQQLLVKLSLSIIYTPTTLTAIQSRAIQHVRPHLRPSLHTVALSLPTHSSLAPNCLLERPVWEVGEDHQPQLLPRREGHEVLPRAEAVAHARHRHHVIG